MNNQCSNSENLYIVYFTITKNDIGTNYTDIQTYYNDLKNVTILGLPGSVTSMTNLNNFFQGLESLNPNNTYNTPNYTLDSTNNGGFLMYLYYYFVAFGISPRRLCNVSFIPIPNESSVQSINVKFSISSSISTDKGRNDNLSEKCLGEWMVQFFKQFDISKPDTNIIKYINTTESNIILNCPKPKISNIIPPSSILSPSLAPSFKPSIAPSSILSPSFTPSIAPSSILSPSLAPSFTPSIDIKNNITNTQLSSGFTSSISYEKFSPVISVSNKLNNGIENFTGVGGYFVSITNINPITFFDYIFQYSYVVSFIGAILYSILSTFNINLGGIIINSNLNLVTSAYIGLCGFLSFCKWFNITLDMIDSALLNVSVIKDIY